MLAEGAGLRPLSLSTLNSGLYYSLRSRKVFSRWPQSSTLTLYQPPRCGHSCNSVSSALMGSPTSPSLCEEHLRFCLARTVTQPSICGGVTSPGAHPPSRPPRLSIASPRKRKTDGCYQGQAQMLDKQNHPMCAMGGVREESGGILAPPRWPSLGQHICPPVAIGVGC